MGALSNWNFYERLMTIGGKTTDNIIDNLFNRKTKKEKIEAQKQINQQNNASTERLAALIAGQNKTEEKDNTTLYVVIAVVVVAAIVYFGWIKK